MEFHPFLQSDENGSPQSMVGEQRKNRIVPDYVVRMSHYNSDLRDLLNAFGCPVNFTPTNLHHAGEVRGSLLTYRLKYKDGLYNRLAKLAERNEEGLVRVREFGKLARRI